MKKIILEILILVWKALRLVLWKWLRPMLGKMLLYFIVAVGLIVLLISVLR